MLIVAGIFVIVMGILWIPFSFQFQLQINSKASSTLLLRLWKTTILQTPLSASSKVPSPKKSSLQNDSSQHKPRNKKSSPLGKSILLLSLRFLCQFPLWKHLLPAFYRITKSQILFFSPQWEQISLEYGNLDPLKITQLQNIFYTYSPLFPAHKIKLHLLWGQDFWDLKTIFKLKFSLFSLMLLSLKAFFNLPWIALVKALLLALQPTKYQREQPNAFIFYTFLKDFLWPNGT